MNENTIVFIITTLVIGAIGGAVLTLPIASLRSWLRSRKSEARCGTCLYFSERGPTPGEAEQLESAARKVKVAAEMKRKERDALQEKYRAEGYRDPSRCKWTAIGDGTTATSVNPNHIGKELECLGGLNHDVPDARGVVLHSAHHPVAVGEQRGWNDDAWNKADVQALNRQVQELEQQSYRLRNATHGRSMGECRAQAPIKITRKVSQGMFGSSDVTTSGFPATSVVDFCGKYRRHKGLGQKTVDELLQGIDQENARIGIDDDRYF